MRGLARRHIEIGERLTQCDAFTHGILPENFMVLRKGGDLHLRMFDFKTNVYWQVISPRLLPGTECQKQRRKMAKVQALFDDRCARREATAG